MDDGEDGTWNVTAATAPERWLGRRVVLRRVVDRSAERLRYSDLVGTLIAADESTLLLRRDGGDAVGVPRVDVHRLKPVPPSTAEILALEEVAAAGWPAPDRHWIGRWLLRAAGGWTGRANSVLPLGDPGSGLDDALGGVRRWYAARGLPARFQVPLPARPALDLALADRGWLTHHRVLVLVADLPLPPTGPERREFPPVEVTLDPTPAWLAAYHYRGSSQLPPIAGRVLTGPEHRGFAEVTIEGEAVAIARVVLTRGWAGVTAVEVTPPWRRRGLGTHVMRGVLGWAVEQGAGSAYLQVADDNAAALAMYERMRFRVHHRYQYRVEPAS